MASHVVCLKASSPPPFTRRQSWGGDPRSQFSDLQRKYPSTPSTPPTRPGTGEENQNDTNILQSTIEPAKHQAEAPESAAETPAPETPAPEPWTRRLSVAAASLVSFILSSSSKIAAAAPRRSVAPDVLKLPNTDNKEPVQHEFKIYKYMNGPKAARETKSFRHAQSKQEGNSLDVGDMRSKNSKWMSGGGSNYEEEQRQKGIETALGMNLTSPILHEADLTDYERARRQRGFDAALRQYKGGRKTKDKLIKAYSYGSGARHDD